MYETNLTKTELILYAILNEFLIYSSVKKKKRTEYRCLHLMENETI